MVIAVGLAAVLGGAAAVGQVVRGGRASTVEAPNNAVGVGSGTKLDLPVRPTVPVTLTVFEDPRSPQSKTFAQGYAATFSRLLASGQVQINYRLVTQSDEKYGGSGAKEAAAAAACAQDQGRLTAFMDQVWQHQPAPGDDALKDRALLIKLAKKAKKIDHDGFKLCVDRDERTGWVAASQSEYAKAHLGDVPLIQLNGRTLPAPATQLTPAKLTTLVKKEAQRVIAAAAP
ncbi:DsbA family protein [Streptomyces gilvosporeus]|uniref:DsbA family protein n=1 Tax=Streptomyces gilvosporeus TaxID=553510 RepID=UPI001F318168|nr:thioredoxin domain-containing protein [Streptomyces gilvosporeus]